MPGVWVPQLSVIRVAQATIDVKWREWRGGASRLVEHRLSPSGDMYLLCAASPMPMDVEITLVEGFKDVEEIGVHSGGAYSITTPAKQIGACAVYTSWDGMMTMLTGNDQKLHVTIPAHEPKPEPEPEPGEIKIGPRTPWATDIATRFADRIEVTPTQAAACAIALVRLGIEDDPAEAATLVREWFTWWGAMTETETAILTTPRKHPDVATGGYIAPPYTINDVNYAECERRIVETRAAIEEKILSARGMTGIAPRPVTKRKGLRRMKKITTEEARELLKKTR